MIGLIFNKKKNLDLSGIAAQKEVNKTVIGVIFMGIILTIKV